MKKGWIGLTAAACTFPAVAIAVPVSLQANGGSIPAPDGSIVIDFVSGNKLAKAGDTVTIRRADLNTSSNTTWHYTNLPDTGYVSVYRETAHEIVFQANHQIITNSYFLVWCIVDGAKSEELQVDLYPPVTTINLSIDGNDTLSGPGNSVTIVADVTNQDGDVRWYYPNIPTGIDVSIQHNTITFINKVPIDTNGSFGVTAENNGANSNLVTVKLAKANVANKIITIGSGIIYDGYQYTGNKHINAAIWQPGSYDYTAIFNDADGLPDSVQDAVFGWDPAIQAVGIELAESNEGTANAKITISWQRNAPVTTFDDPLVVNFFIYSKSNPTVRVDIIVNIDFYTIVEPSWVGTQPSNLTGTTGNATFHAKCNGQGIIGDPGLVWKVRQNDGSEDGLPLPTTDWQFTLSPYLPYGNDFTFGWTYSGTSNAVLDLLVIVASHANDDKKIATLVRLTAKVTNKVVITGNAVNPAFASTAGSTDYLATYSGTEPDTNTDWSIVTVNGQPYTGSDITLTPKTQNNIATLAWNNQLIAQDYTVVIKAAWHNDSSLFSTFNTVIHSRGSVTSLDAITNNAGGQTTWSGDNGATFNIRFSTHVNGTNVDQTINWTIEVVNKSGYGDPAYSIDANGNFSIVCSNVKFNNSCSISLKIHASSTQDPSKEATPTGTLNFQWSYY